MGKNYYNILEVNPKACQEVIHMAYRTLALKHASNPKILQDLNEAKEILLNTDKRSAYDKENSPKKVKKIGNYILEDAIAEGGFGTTYKARHELLGTHVCIKHANQISLQDEEIMKEEAKAIWDLRHWAIPAIREIIKLDDNSLAIVMSYVPGATLGQIVEKHGKLEPEHVCWITERVLNALRYLHTHGVVHGDVKPQNIIVQPDRHSVVLVDYGLSAVKPNSTTKNKGFTPYFASPEQTKGMPLIPESDLFSLGMTMIYALGGDVTSKAVPPSVPDEICKFIKNLIQFNVLSRPNWQKEDLCQSISDVREKSFGRRFSKMKPLPI